MATAFRKHRKRALLAKRLKQYIPYAIGEILLVVIGIMIALQLNNWNEDRKNNLKSAKLHAQLYQELTAAHGYIDSRVEYLTAYAQYLEFLIQNWHSMTFRDATERIPYEFARTNFTFQFYLTSYSEFYDPKHNIFDKAISDGSIAGLNADFVAALNSVYVARKSRINQMLEEEYRLAQDINTYIATKFAKELTLAKREGNDWDETTYENLFAAYRQDGSLRSLIDARLQLVKGRIFLTKDSVELAKNALNRYKEPKIN